MSGVTFGSYGDFRTAIPAVHKLVTILSTPKYEQEAAELRQTLSQYVSVMKSISYARAPPGVRTAIAYSVEECNKALLDFSGRLESVETSGVESGSRWLGFLRPVHERIVKPLQWQWSKEGFDRLKEKLDVHINIINTVLTAAALQVQPVPTGTRTQGGTVSLVDMLDRTIHIPLSFCRDSMMLHDFLVCAFKDRAGQSLIKRRGYSVLTRDDNGRLCQSDLTAKFKPGMQLFICALFKVADRKLRKCPVCKKKLRRRNGEVICTYCSTHLQITNDNIVDSPTAPPSHPVESVGQNPPITFNFLENDPKPDEAEEMGDVQFIRWFHVEVPKLCSLCKEPYAPDLQDDTATEKYEDALLRLRKMLPKKWEQQPLCDDCLIKSSQYPGYHRRLRR